MADRTPGAERLSDGPIQAFLATKEVVILGVARPPGAPLVVPMWFLPDPDAITMISVDGLAKVRALRRDGRVTVLAEAGTRGAAIRSVTISGRARFLEDGPERRTLAERFLARYRPDLERLWGGPAMPANRVMFRIEPERVRSRGL
jgi:nitroimidazol reductase NimA-like FMN-containing flavoprotein (pyridoxamine 5'-phosphate oxidase superfamily)